MKRNLPRRALSLGGNRRCDKIPPRSRPFHSDPQKKSYEFDSSSTTGAQGAYATDSYAPVYTYSVPAGGYASNSNLLAHSDNIMGDWAFQYDTRNRLTAMAPSTNAPAAYVNLIGCYNYDSFGNRTLAGMTSSDCTGSNPVTAKYSNRNQVTFVSQANPISYSAPTGFTYDAAGNVTVDGQNNYAYDGEGRICAVKNLSGGYYGYLYNASGIRVAMGTISSLSCNLSSNGFQLQKQFLLDQTNNQVTELDGSGNWKHSNVWAGAHLDATYDALGVHFHLADPLGTRRVQTDVNGEVENRFQSLPYGDLFISNPTSLSTSDDATEHHFTGKERDQETGNDYFFARYYSSAMGRFMSPDWSSKPEPVPYSDFSNPQSLNLYAYANNNPLGRDDQDGHCSAPSVQSGHVGICLESYIQKARFGFLNMGHGDDRGPVANDPNATFRTQTMIDVNLGSQSVTEHSTAGLSVTTAGSEMGVVHDWISDSQKGSDGSTTFTVHVYGENGYEAKNVPFAPGGWIEMVFTMKVSADGKVSVVKKSSETKAFPSVSIFSYQSNGGISDVYQQKESGNINDLNKPMSHLQGAADEACARTGNPAACNN